MSGKFKTALVVSGLLSSLLSLATVVYAQAGLTSSAVQSRAEPFKQQPLTLTSKSTTAKSETAKEEAAKEAAKHETARLETAKPATAKPAASDLPTYLALMRPRTHLYLHIMLSLIARDGMPVGDSDDSQVTVTDIEGLQEQLSAMTPPAELERAHISMAKSLAIVAKFVKDGGADKIGFHSALEVAQQMQAISDSYHESVLALIQERGLPAASDPFLVEKVVAKSADKAVDKGASKSATKTANASDKRQNVQPLGVRLQTMPNALPSDHVHGLSGASAGVDFDAGLKVPSSASTTPTMIDGVGGSMGLSGMFNGLGGTGTNGLVDGMGFSSGLNGFVNGAGSSSGMSGMINDLNTSTASGTGKY